MHKDFDRWNKQKKSLDAHDSEPLYFREGEIWWVHLGVNIGYEIDGKQSNFARPVIILRKYNKHSFLALPLTTSVTPSRYKISVGMISGKHAFAVTSQLRNIDSRRLYQKVAWLHQKVAWLHPDTFLVIRNETFRINSMTLRKK
jgi:mRNA interferase MazF